MKEKRVAICLECLYDLEELSEECTSLFKSIIYHYVMDTPVILDLDDTIESEELVMLEEKMYIISTENSETTLQYKPCGCRYDEKRDVYVVCSQKGKH